MYPSMGGRLTQTITNTLTMDPGAAQEVRAGLATGRLLVWSPGTSKCPRARQLTLTAPDVFVVTLHGWHRRRCMNGWMSGNSKDLWIKALYKIQYIYQLLYVKTPAMSFHLFQSTLCAALVHKRTRPINSATSDTCVRPTMMPLLKGSIGLYT